MLTLGTVAAVSGIVLMAAAIQRIVGFGDALLAVPLMTFVVPTKSAVVIAFLTGTVAIAWLSVRFLPQIEWRTTRLLGAGTIVGAPPGVVILSVVSAVALRLTLGVVVCITAVWIIVSSRRSDRPAAANASRTIAMGVASGVLSTSLATNGPPLVYELRRTGFADDRFRATISAAFMISNAIGLPLLAVAGQISVFDIKLAAASLVACVIGITLGSWVSGRMQTTHFVWAADLLLLATGAVTIAKVVF
jgi:hypothetical protein